MIPLLILGLLKEKEAAYGYEMLALMDERNYRFVVNYTKGSFYYNLQQLEEKQLIERVSSQEQTSEAITYRLTAKGDQRFEELMVKYGSKTDYVNLSFYAAMLFDQAYDTKKMEQLIDTQIKETEIKLTLLEEALKDKAALQANFAKMLENSVAHHRVNLAWFRSLKEEIEEK